MKRINYKQENKILVLFLIIFIILNALSLSLVYKSQNNSKVHYFSKIEFKYINMTEEEQAEAYSLIRNIYSPLLSPIKEITFAKDNFYCESDDKEKTVWDSAIGTFYKDKIIVEWKGNFSQNAQTLCHEVLHAHFKSMGGKNQFEDDSHAGLDFISNKYACYEDERVFQ